MNLDPPFKDPGIPDGERTAFRGTIDGETVGEPCYDRGDR